MIGRSLLAAALVVAFATPALAFNCPLNVKAIDAGLPKTNLSAAQKAEVQKLRDEGLAQHNGGKHKESMVTLSKAMQIILNNM
ncbi:MAG: hypothetical protein ACE5JZ_04070 [Kiloniellales bacterium]